MPTSKTKKRNTKTTAPQASSDSAFFLKLVMYLILSSMWLRIQTEAGTETPLPIGAAIALVFAFHDHFQIDKRIEIAVILIGMFIAFWLPVGVFIAA